MTLKAEPKQAALWRRATAEGPGTMFLPAAVVGSGIMAERLAYGNLVLALLANTIATGAALVSLILTFGPISSAHFNPAVTPTRSLGDTFAGIRPGDVPGLILAELAGASAATMLFRWLAPALPEIAEAVVVPHDT